MKYADIIDMIRRLANGEDACDENLSEQLLNSGCWYLLSKSVQYSSKQMTTVMINSIFINQRYQACKDVFERIQDIPYAHIKGAILSSYIYGNPAFRLSGDIDLLIPPRYSGKVKAVLDDCGFVQGKLVDGKIIPYSRKELIYQKSFSHQLAPFMKETGSQMCPFVNIDVNLDIIWGEGDFSIDMENFVCHTEEFEFQGIKLRKLNPAWEFISLCMHHYKDMNSIYLIADRGLSLSEFCDIYFYLVNVSPNVDELTDVAREYGVCDYIYYCIYYTNKIFADARLSKYLDKLRSNSAEKLLDCYGLSDFERRKWNISFYERLFDPRFKDKFRSALTNDEMRKIQINRDFM